MKESLIEAADYSLWFLLENQGTWRKIWVYFSLMEVAELKFSVQAKQHE